MDRTEKLYGFDKVEDFAKYLIDHARQERLSINITLNEAGFMMTVEPLENRVYLCPHYGETRENR